MIDSAILPARDYNTIPDFNENQAQLFDRVSRDTLVTLGEIFIKHGVASNFGVHLLHHHFPIPDGTIMLYNYDDFDMEICSITPLDQVSGMRVRGRNFRVNETGRFVAYEYDIGDEFRPSHEFLVELSDHIIKNDLQDFLSLEYDPTPWDDRQRSEYIINCTALVKVRKTLPKSPTAT